ncbi:MAG: ArsA family ATPase [Deltaproteobacteria bacterium]|nr:ArsA family ATPase [Deltaproteobacteria bacterium]
MESRALWNRRLIVVAGKGGVGRTTVALALALALARRGKRTLLVEINVPDRVGALFGRPPIGASIVDLAPNLQAVNIEPHAARKEYGLLVLRYEFIYNRVFENSLVRGFLNAFPGLDDLNILGKIWFHEGERDKAGRPRFDAIVVDAPPTGNASYLFRLPHVMVDAIRVGPLVEKAKEMRALVTDPRKTALVLVALPEEMPVNEAIDFSRLNDAKIHIPAGYGVVNAYTDSPLSEREQEDFRRLRSHATDVPGLAALVAAHDAKHFRHRIERGHVDKFVRELSMPHLKVARRFGGEMGRREIDAISAEIEQQVNEKPLA